MAVRITFMILGSTERSGYLCWARIRAVLPLPDLGMLKRKYACQQLQNSNLMGLKKHHGREKSFSSVLSVATQTVMLKNWEFFLKMTCSYKKTLNGLHCFLNNNNNNNKTLQGANRNEGQTISH